MLFGYQPSLCPNGPGHLTWPVVLQPHAVPIASLSLLLGTHIGKYAEILHGWEMLFFSRQIKFCLNFLVVEF